MQQPTHTGRPVNNNMTNDYDNSTTSPRTRNSKTTRRFRANATLWLTPKTRPSPPRYYITTSNIVVLRQQALEVGRSPNVARAEASPLRLRGVADPLEIRPTCYPAHIWSLQVEQYDRNYEDPPEKFDRSRPAFKVTQGYPNRHELISHLWLPITVSYQPRSYLVPFPR